MEEAQMNRPKPVKSPAAEHWLQLMRAQLEKRGSNTQKMLAIRFRIMDDDKKAGIAKNEFMSVCWAPPSLTAFRCARPRLLSKSCRLPAPAAVQNACCARRSGMLEMGVPVEQDVTDTLFDYYTFGGGPKEGTELNFEQFVV